MIPAVTRLYALLRSRRLAVALIAAVTLYAVVGTIVPQRDVGGPDRYPAWAAEHPDLARWAETLGLDEAFSTPLFIVLAATLGAATLACAFERSRASLRAARRLGTEGLTAAGSRANSAPGGRLASGKTPGELERDVAAALRGSGYRVTPVAGGPAGVKGGIGLLGSPLFHWALGLLIVTVGVAQLFISVGFVEVPEQGVVGESHEAYAKLREGALFRERHTGIGLAVASVDPDHLDNGVAVGASPVVVLTRDGRELARQYVHSNRPLRLGDLMIHYYEYGMGADVELVATDGSVVDRSWLHFPLSQESSVGVSGASAFDLGGRTGVNVSAVVPLDAVPGGYTHAAPKEQRLEVTVRDGSGTPRNVVLRPGETMTLAPDLALRLVRVSHSVVLTVTNDPTLPLVYALISLTVIGLAVTVLVPTRAVWLTVTAAEGGGSEIRARVWSRRKDPLFRERLIARLKRELDLEKDAANREERVG